MTSIDSPTRPRPMAWDSSARPLALPVLIQVPALRSTARHKPRPSTQYTRPKSRRRRLRREVRWAGSALVFLGLPMTWMALAFLGAGPSEDARGADAESRLSAPPAVSLSIEPLSPPTVADSEVPVVRPAGYILPDDGIEEASHAGS